MEDRAKQMREYRLRKKDPLYQPEPIVVPSFDWTPLKPKNYAPGVEDRLKSYRALPSLFD